MKKKILFFPLLATLALTSCQSNDEPINVGNNTESKDCGFVAVNIVQPKAATFKAGTAPTGFEYGLDAENKAENGLFFVFNEAGTQMYGNPQVLSLTPNETSVGDNSPVEKIYEAVLVLDGVKNNPVDQAVQIVCVLNAPAELAEATTLAELKEKMDNSTINAAGPFIMSNSVYKDGGKAVLGAEIKKTDIYLSADSALHNPVNIYVERTVAKVRTNAVNEMTNTTGADPVVDGVQKHLTIEITGLEIANIAQSAYMFKNLDLDQLGSSYDWAWDVTNHRSYWETTPVANKQTYKNKTYTDITYGFDPTKGIEGEYIRPNTANTKTAVLVTAKLKDDSNYADLVYLRGSYFNTEKAKNLIAQYLANNGYYKEVAANSYTQLTKDDLDWENKVDNPLLTWLKSYEVVAKIKIPESGIAPTLKKLSAGTYVDATVDEVNQLLAGNADNAPYKARVFNQGSCYYFVNIDQSPLSGTTYTPHQYDGVVRNHIYDLTLNSIAGIGIPVFDPTDTIVPEDLGNEKLYYLAASVNVLDWKLVKQEINFNH